MFLKHIKLSNFRNYVSLDTDFVSTLNIFVGDNAQGKTNLLEAIYLLATGRSYRASRDQEFVNWQAPGFNIKAEIHREFGTVTLEIGYIKDQRKRIKVNGADLPKLSELFGHLNVVAFSPEDLQLVKGAPAYRRRFLDLELSQVNPQYRHELISYHQILLQRNNLLKEMQAGRGDRQHLDVWDEQLSKSAVKISIQRMAAVEKMASLANRMQQLITEGKEELSLKYVPSISGLGETSFAEGPACEKALLQLQSLRKMELSRGITLMGPHRDELSIQINKVDARTFGSQGQQRTVALALKLAELEFMRQETGEYPILLLDDVMSELDYSRRQFLTEAIRSKVQVFMTTTGLHSFQEAQLAESRLFRISNGIILTGFL